MNDQQPFKGLPNASEMSHYGGIPYTLPERVAQRYSSDEVDKVSRGAWTWRVVLAVALGAIGLVNLVRLVLFSADALRVGATAPTAGIVGAAILALLFLLYPVVVAVQWRRARV